MEWIQLGFIKLFLLFLKNKIGYFCVNNCNWSVKYFFFSFAKKLIKILYKIFVILLIKKKIYY